MFFFFTVFFLSLLHFYSVTLVDDFASIRALTLACLPNVLSCNTTEFDRSYTALMMGRAWYGGRSAAETRANFENVKGADVYSLTSSIFMVATCDALRKFLSTLISDVVFTLVDPRPGFGGNTFCYYVPDSTKNYGFKTASDAVAQLELFKQTTF